jgi:hypothetical protein
VLLDRARTAPHSMAELQAVATHLGETGDDLLGEPKSADYEIPVLIAIKGGTEWVVMVAGDTPTPQSCSVMRPIIEPKPDRPPTFPCHTRDPMNVDHSPDDLVIIRPVLSITLGCSLPKPRAGNGHESASETTQRQAERNRVARREEHLLAFAFCDLSWPLMSSDWDDLPNERSLRHDNAERFVPTRHNQAVIARKPSLPGKCRRTSYVFWILRCRTRAP